MRLIFDISFLFTISPSTRIKACKYQSYPHITLIFLYLISTDAKGGYKRFKTLFMSRIPYVNAKGDSDIEKLVKRSMELSNVESELVRNVILF